MVFSAMAFSLLLHFLSPQTYQHYKNVQKTDAVGTGPVLPALAMQRDLNVGRAVALALSIRHAVNAGSLISS